MMSDPESAPASQTGHSTGPRHPSRRSRPRGARGRGRSRGRRPMPPGASTTAPPVAAEASLGPSVPEDITAEAAVEEDARPAAPSRGEADEETFFARPPEAEPMDQAEEPGRAQSHTAPGPGQDFDQEAPSPHPPRRFHPAPAEAIKQAIDEVMVVLSSLR